MRVIEQKSPYIQEPLFSVARYRFPLIVVQKKVVNISYYLLYIASRVCSYERGLPFCAQMTILSPSNV
jgi:hypothetical protein